MPVVGCADHHRMEVSLLFQQLAVIIIHRDAGIFFDVLRGIRLIDIAQRGDLHIRKRGEAGSYATTLTTDTDAADAHLFVG